MTDAGLPPDGWQRDLLRSEARRVLMLTTRQAGKSTTSGFLALREALLCPGSTSLVVSPTQRQSAELVRRVRDAVGRLRGAVALGAESALSVELANRSRIIALPASEGGIRGFTGRLVIVDEAARVPDPIIAAVRPMLATTGGKLVCLSSAFAKSGWFYEQWAGTEPWDRVKVTAPDCPRIAPAFLAEERRVLGDNWFMMEYMCEFMDDVASVFSTADVRGAVSPAVAPLFAPRPGPGAPAAPAPGPSPLFLTDRTEGDSCTR